MSDRISDLYLRSGKTSGGYGRDRQVPGRYHATNEGLCTWYEFATEIFRQAGKEITVHPVTSEQFPSKAKRPHNSRMSKDKLEANGFDRLPTWQDALNRYLKTIGVIEA